MSATSPDRAVTSSARRCAPPGDVESRRWILRPADRLPGLYTVRIDDHGERRFSYWRSASAARHLFAGTGWVAHLRDVDVLHLSGATLQLASDAAREHLVDRLAALRSGGVFISFDTNYRPSGWENPDEAARVMDQVAKVATLCLPPSKTKSRCITAGRCATLRRGSPTSGFPKSSSNPAPRVPMCTSVATLCTSPRRM